jgi:RHS repeat-associated protein
LERIGQNQLINSTWTPSFYGYDGTEGGGTVRLLTDTSGTVTDTYDYDAYGNVLNSTGATPNNYLYRGEQYDADLNLYYLRARYFNPITGRFLTKDPFAGNITVPSTLHRYNYASADPVNRLDPSGRSNITEGTLLDAFVLTLWGAASPKVKGMADSIWCIWDNATSWLKLGLWVDELPAGDQVTGLTRDRCEVHADVAVPECKVVPGMGGREPTPAPMKWYGGLPPFGGLHWCGPGGSGIPVNQVDAACRQHDLCYEVEGLGERNYYPKNNTPEEQARKDACDQYLCCLLGNMTPKSKWEMWDLFGVAYWFGCRLPSTFGMGAMGPHPR